MRRPNVQAILTSGYANPDANPLFMFVPKPWRRGDLERALEAAAPDTEAELASKRLDFAPIPPRACGR